MEFGVQKIWTLPLLLTQLYLPFSELRFAYQILQNDQRVIAAKNNYDITMSTLGMSTPQNSNEEFISIDRIPFTLFFQRLLLRPYPKCLCLLYL